MKLFTKKPMDVLLAQASEEGEHTLKRGLGPVSLTALGVGGIIGAGIFVLTGQQAAMNAGPGIVLSFVLAGLVCAFAALCYAELASMIPVSGSAYTYTYATLGEFFAWIIAWDLILEYGIAAATVSVGWSGYFNNLLGMFGVHLSELWSSAPYALQDGELVRTGAILNVPAVMIIALMASALVAGIGHSAVVNNVIVALKTLVVVTVIVVGFAHVNPANWHPFIPAHIPPTSAMPQGQFGWQGVAAAASVIFFAYIGFEGVSTAAQEARDPQRTMPIGILASLGICTVLYMLMALVITGLAPYQTLNNPAPVATALQAIPELNWLRSLVNVGVTVGLGSTILALLYGQSRIFYSMARDGLLPPIFGKVNPRTRTPAAGTIVVALLAAVAGGLLPIGILGELVSMGTLLAFGLICAGVMYLRVTHPDLPRTFRTPFVFVTAPIGLLGCAYLIYKMPPSTWTRLWVWMALGLVVYFGYAYWHSRFHERKAAAAAAE
ncbi:MAG: amino acid permease [Phenylobacterium sp.]